MPHPRPMSFRDLAPLDASFRERETHLDAHRRLVRSAFAKRATPSAITEDEVRELLVALRARDTALRQAGRLLGDAVEVLKAAQMFDEADAAAEAAGLALALAEECKS